MSSCSNKHKEVTIFSIPNDATPSELKEQGFRISRDLNFVNEVDSEHNGKIEYCQLDLVYAQVNIDYGEDTTRINHYSINIDFKPFQELTGKKAKAYSTVNIDGFNYKAKVNDDQMSLYLTRIGK